MTMLLSASVELESPTTLFKANSKAPRIRKWISGSLMSFSSIFN
jgi:hypothetical protein